MQSDYLFLVYSFTTFLQMYSQFQIQPNFQCWNICWTNKFLKCWHTLSLKFWVDIAYCQKTLIFSLKYWKQIATPNHSFPHTYAKYINVIKWLNKWSSSLHLHLLAPVRSRWNKEQIYNLRKGKLFWLFSVMTKVTTRNASCICSSYVPSNPKISVTLQIGKLKLFKYINKPSA